MKHLLVSFLNSDKRTRKAMRNNKMNSLQLVVRESSVTDLGMSVKIRLFPPLMKIIMQLLVVKYRIISIQFVVDFDVSKH